MHCQEPSSAQVQDSQKPERVSPGVQLPGGGFVPPPSVVEPAPPVPGSHATSVHAHSPLLHEHELQPSPAIASSPSAAQGSPGVTFCCELPSSVAPPQANTTALAAMAAARLANSPEIRKPEWRVGVGFTSPLAFPSCAPKTA